MHYHRKAELEELRKTQPNADGDLELYAVYNHLANPVMKIKHLSKKYVYWFDDTKHPYPSNAAGYVVFDNKVEAWKYYKMIFEKRKADIQERYERDMQQLTRATEILNKCSEETPEYFI